MPLVRRISHGWMAAGRLTNWLTDWLTDQFCSPTTQGTWMEDAAAAVRLILERPCLGRILWPCVECLRKTRQHIQGTTRLLNLVDLMTMMINGRRQRTSSPPSSRWTSFWLGYLIRSLFDNVIRWNRQQADSFNLQVVQEITSYTFHTLYPHVPTVDDTIRNWPGLGSIEKYESSVVRGTRLILNLRKFASWALLFCKVGAVTQ